MQIIQTISMDLAFRGITPRIYGKQGDSGAMRGVRIELFNAGAAYKISSGTTFLLRYKTAQNAIGLYDALPDGTSAFAFAAGENAVTITFVDQMFAQPGDVECELRIVEPEGLATTWKWILDVERENVGDAEIPSDYINAFNALAASAANAAERAETAAESIDTSKLMRTSDYDASLAVMSAGGIVKYIASAIAGISPTVKLEPLVPFDRSGYFDVGPDAGIVASTTIINQTCYRYGPIAVAEFTIELTFLPNRKACAIAFEGAPELLIPVAASGVLEGMEVVGSAAVSSTGSTSRQPVVHIALFGDAAPERTTRTLSVSYAYLIRE